MLLWVLGIESHIEKMAAIVNGSDRQDTITFLFIFSSLIFAPILEELAFRHPLKDFETNFLPSMLAILFLIILSVFNKKIVGLLILLLGLIYTLNWLLLRQGRIQAESSSKVLYVLSLIFFVIAHFGTLDVLIWEYWPLYILYAIHMGVCAFFLAKIRLLRNTYHSMFLHFLLNLIPALVLIF